MNTKDKLTHKKSKTGDPVTMILEKTVGILILWSHSIYGYIIYYDMFKATHIESVISVTAVINYWTCH